jgi:hypothetical protein
MPDHLTGAEITQGLEVCGEMERKAKHFDGDSDTREHYIGCGKPDPCPGEPDWSFARTLLPRALEALREARVALQDIVYVLGPEPHVRFECENACQGCQHEMGEALRLALVATAAAGKAASHQQPPNEDDLCAWARQAGATGERLVIQEELATLRTQLMEARRDGAKMHEAQQRWLAAGSKAGFVFGPGTVEHDPEFAKEIAQISACSEYQDEAERLTRELAEARAALREAVAIFDGELGKDWADYYGPAWKMIDAVLSGQKGETG